MAKITLQVCVVVGFLLNFSTSSSMHHRGLKSTDHCEETQRIYKLKGFNNTAPSKPVSGLALEICPRELSCCTKDMEVNLQKKRAMDYITAVAEKSSSLKNVFGKKYKKFNDFFQSLVENARSKLDDLFYRTYGDLYSLHKQVFMELFEDLKKYYHGAVVDVDEMFEAFFTEVMQRVFELINPSYMMDDDYMQCIADNMHIIKPFADMNELPQAITSQMRRAFIEAKTFVHGLDVGRTVVQNLAKISLSHECEVAMTKMTYCSACHGVNATKPCHNYCVNIMRACMVDYDSVSKVWKTYIDAMLMLLNRLEGAFSIEAVLGPFEIKMSDAIMTLQDHKLDITDAVFRNCGNPPKNPNVTESLIGFGMVHPHMNFEDFDASLSHLGPSFADTFPEFSFGDEDSKDIERTKRSVASSGSRKRRKHRKDRHERHLQGKEEKTKKISKKLSLAEEQQMRLQKSIIEDIRYRYNEAHDTIEGRHTPMHTALGTNLATLAPNARKVLGESRSHYETLPVKFCENESDDVDSSTCWNGEGVGKYDHSVVPNGLQHQFHNPEVAVDEKYEVHDTISSQIHQLKRIITQLKQAYKGIDPQRGVDDEDSFEYSGEGSAEGSGEPGNYTEPIVARTLPPKVCPDCGGSSSLSRNLSTLTLMMMAALLLTV